MLKEVKNKSPIMFLWATAFVMFGVMHFLDIIIGNNMYADEIMIQASIFVIFFCCIYLGVRCVLKKKLYSVKQLKNIFQDIYICGMNDGKRYSAVYFIFITACIMLTTNVILLSGGIFNTSWGSGHEIGAARKYFSLDKLWPFLYLALGGTFCCALLKKKKIAVMITGLCILFVEAVLRSKIYIMPLMIGFIAVYIFKLKKIRLSAVVMGFTLGIIVILLLYVIQVTRWMGTWENVLDEFSIGAAMAQLRYFGEASEGELFLRKWFYYFIEHNNKFDNFGMAHSYIRMLFVYVPTRLSFGLKPPDFAISMGAAVGMQEGGSMHPTIFGDCYANLGSFGVLLGALWAVIACFADFIIVWCKNSGIKVLLFVLMGTSFVIIGRGAVYNGYSYSAMGIPILIILDRLKVPLPGIKFVWKGACRYE